MKTLPPERIAQMPGSEYLAEGLSDLAAGRESLPALLLSIAAGRLSEAGVPVPEGIWPDPDFKLYRLLQRSHGDEAHSQYNAHLRRLSSLCRALESARSAGMAD